MSEDLWVLDMSRFVCVVPERLRGKILKAGESDLFVSECSGEEERGREMHE